MRKFWASLQVFTLLFIVLLFGYKNLYTSPSPKKRKASNIDYFIEAANPRIGHITPFIHQCFFNDNLSNAPSIYSVSKSSLTRHNPNFRYHLWTESEAEELINRFYPGLQQVWRKFNESFVLRVDFFRYIVLHFFGGVYADVDAEAISSFDTLLEEFPGCAILGIEVDFSRLPNWREMFQVAREVQICQWTLISPPGHPLLSILLSWIAKNASLVEDPLHGDVMELTGPGIFMDCVLFYLKGLGFGRDAIENIRNPRRFHDLVILPKRSFRKEGGDPDSYAFVTHHFLGSWKK